MTDKTGAGKGSRAGVLAGGALLAAGLLGRAAPVAADVAQPVDGEPAGALEEIVVTAERRSENLQRAALAISAVTGEALAKAGIADAQGITSAVPAVQIASGSGPYNLFYLRGVGSFNVNPLSDSAISFNVDGVSVSRPSSTSGVFYDLERVEILKGPQGTLYGRNATGGALNVITRDPKLDDTSGELTADVGNYKSRKFEGAASLPLGESAAVRAAFATSDHDGYLSDGTADDKSAAGRLRFLIEVRPDLTLKVGGDFYHQGGRGGGAALLTDGFAEQRVGNTDPRAQAIYQSTLFFPAGSTLPPLPEFAHSDNTYWGVNGTLEWRSDTGTLTVLPAFRHSDINYSSPLPGLYVIEDTVSKQSSVEARFASNDTQPLRWLLGTYYLNESDRTALDYDSQYNLSHQRLSLPLTSEAAFGRLTYAIVDSLRVTTGVRYTRDEKRIEGNGGTANVLCFAALQGGNPLGCAGTPGFPYSNVPPPEFAASAAQGGAPVPYGTEGAVLLTTPVAMNDRQIFTKTTWRGGVEWDVAAHSLVYASVETGFKAGGFFFANINPTYKPETITAYTLGSKNRFLDSRLQLNAELFYWKYKDQQISHITQQSDGAVVLATENVGRATIKGLEADALFAVADGSLVGADLQYLKATYDRFAYSVPNLGGPPVANCPFVANGGSFTIDCSRRSAPQSPEWTLALNAEQKLSVGAAGNLVLDVQSKYQTASYVGLEYLASQRQAGYWMSNAQLSFNPAAGRWSVGAYVANIEDATVKTDAFPHPLVGGQLVSSPLRPPRTFGVRAGVHF